eukprot:c8849_g1_i1 orf=1-792(-)
MAPVRPLLPSLRRALYCQKTAVAMAASTDTLSMCTGTFLLCPCLGFSSFSTATRHKAYHTESGGSKNYPYLPPSPPQPPQIIAWHPFLGNSINVLGKLMQHVDIAYLDSGHTRGTCVVRLVDGINRYTVFEVELWDELAEMAGAHMEAGDLVHVAGILHVVNTSDDAQKNNLQWKVTARELNFVTRKDHGWKMNGENVQNIGIAVDEDKEKIPVHDDHSSKVSIAVDKDKEKTPVQDNHSSKVSINVDRDKEKTPVDDGHSNKV